MTQKRKYIYYRGIEIRILDSICSAISYAYLKNKIGNANYIPARAGKINEETSFVLKYFNESSPELLLDVEAKLKT